MKKAFLILEFPWFESFHGFHRLHVFLLIFYDRMKDATVASARTEPRPPGWRRRPEVEATSEESYR
jgi:hypothetical protein